MKFNCTLDIIGQGSVTQKARRHQREVKLVHQQKTAGSQPWLRCRVTALTNTQILEIGTLRPEFEASGEIIIINRCMHQRAFECEKHELVLFLLG